MVNKTKIKTLGKEKVVSLTFLCQKVGQGAWYLNDVAKGKAPMPPERLAVIAEVLDVTPDYLCDKTEERKKPSPEPVLTEREKAILEIFRSLPEEKQDKLIERLENM